MLLMPISGSELPNMHEATGRDWSVWWDWKQTLPEKQACYYAKLLRNRGVFVSWRWFPQFYAAQAEGRPYWRLYRDGLLSQTEKRLLDLLEERGPMMTRHLRLAYGPRSKENTRRVKHALANLQRRMLVCPAGGSTEGWSHHRWALVEKWVPLEALTAARSLSRQEARAALVRKHIENALATTVADIAWLFGWERAEAGRIVERLLREGSAAAAVVEELEGEVVIPNPWPGGGRR